MMDLNEVLYCLGSDTNQAKLTVEPVENDGYEAVLYDQIHEVCRVRYPEGDTRKQGEARAKGSTVQAACKALAVLLAGSYLSHEVPIMWTSSTYQLRVPPTLVIGVPTITTAAEMRRAEQPATEKVT